MNSNREELLFQLALTKSADERAEFLASECREDEALRARLHALLAAHEQPETLLATQADRRDELHESPSSSQGLTELGPPSAASRPTIKLDLDDAPDEAVGQTLGRYKLLEQIGEGGCGMVYVAEQKEPVRRKVALKVIKLGMDTKQVVARFEAERQALAMMDHPNIAKVLDAGTTDVGRPYFVMELVRGIRITDYCDQANLSTKERLDLFIKVCHAIQHAHQKGIIHRDIKPSNILVTLHDGVPVPKVIDFGIAKATQGELTDKTIHTQFQQFIGTPAYMSPEQAEMSGLDIDTRSDIYSLGVLLYELLAGSTPFDPKELMSQGIDAMRKTIREKEPQRPSTRFATLGADQLTTTAKRRSADTSKLLHQLKGDLDWIVMKCLEKDRQRRYDTANGLAADLKRHLDNEPVTARPPSAAYKFQKAFRRNKLVFAAGGAVALALVLGMIGTSIGTIRAERQRRVADQAQRLARENFDQARAAVREMLAVSAGDLYNKPGMQPLRVKLLRTAIEHYRSFLNQTSTDPVLRAEFGRLCMEYGFAAQDIGESYSHNYTNVVLPAYDSALAIQRQLVKEQPDNRSFRDDLGWSLVFARLWHDPTGVETNQPEAVAIFEGLIREDGKDSFARLGLAWALGINIDRYLPESPEKEVKSQRRLSILEQLVKEYPRSAAFRRDLANQLSFMARKMGDDDDEQRLGWISRGNELRRGVLADLEQNESAMLEPLPKPDSVYRILRPSALYATFDLANGLQLQASVLRRLKRWDEALSCVDQSVALWSNLVEQNPSVTRFADFLDGTFKTAVRVLEEAGDRSGAEARRVDAENFWRTHPQVRRQNR